MGNCLWCLKKKTSYKENGVKFTEYPSLINESVTDVFEIMRGKYPDYRIMSIIDGKSTPSTSDFKIIHIYYNAASQTVNKIEVYD